MKPPDPITKAVLAILVMFLVAPAGHAAPGDLDPTFGNGGKTRTGFGFGRDKAEAVAIVGGTLILAGESVDGSQAGYALARYNLADGSLDPTFDGDGKLFTPRDASLIAMKVQGDGKIVAAGTIGIGSGLRDFIVLRFNANGTLDPTFGGDGEVIIDLGTANDFASGLVIQADGRIVVVGQVSFPGTGSETGRTDNQLRTLNHLGMLNPAPNEMSFATYLRSVAVSNTTVPVQHRMRSWIDANCSQCHRPGGFGPGYDGRFYTPLENQNLINSYVRFRDVGRSELYRRDNALDEFKMPPLAKNIVHETAMATLRQWIASPLEILSVYLYQDNSHLAVRFNSHVDPETATVVSNYSLDQGLTVTGAVAGPEPATVILSVSPLTPNQTYLLTTTGVQDTAPSANTIWPRSNTPFTAQHPPAATSPAAGKYLDKASGGPGR